VQIPLFQVDAFTSKRFHGNPAAICPLESWLPDAVMQAIAAENNLAETAFFAREGSDYRLRWFTPTTEVKLCGHATLASAYVLYERLGYAGDAVRFHSLGGLLTVRRRGGRYELDFPAMPAAPVDPHPAAVEGLRGAPVQAWLASERDYMAVFEDADTVASLDPDFGYLANHAMFGLIATAPGTECDFVSRFFVPKAGVNEDPVTGSTHCTLIPYWADRLGKRSLHARQISARGGEIFGEALGERVAIAGQAVLYLEGTIHI